MAANTRSRGATAATATTAGAAALALGLLYGCHSAGPATPLSVAPRVTTGSSSTVPPVSEPVVSRATLQSALLRPADAGPGFEVPASSDSGAGVLATAACGQPLVPATGAVNEAREVLVRPSDQAQVVERVDSYRSAGEASAVVAALRNLAGSCHQAGLSPLSPLAVGEEVAGLALTAGKTVSDVALIRSGPIVATVVLTAPNPLAPAAWQALLQGVGTQLAVATGG